jgi:hypothetical protein
VLAQGLELPPVAKTGYWTDRASNDSRFWPHHYEPRFYPCDARSVRGVCFGFPALDLPARNAEVPPGSLQRRACSCRARACAAVRPRAMRRPLTSPAAAAQCQNRRVYGVCDDWPHIEYAVPPDPARCRAGYTGTRCSACISHELRQCVPADADAEDGWYSWKVFQRMRARRAFVRRPVADCYAIGECGADTDEEECKAIEAACVAEQGVCRWDTARFHRSFDGTCEKCPFGIVTGFVFYVVWFAAFGAVVRLPPSAAAARHIARSAPHPRDKAPDSGGLSKSVEVSTEMRCIFYASD